MLGAFRSFLQALECERVFRDVDAFLLLVFANEDIPGSSYRIVAAEMRVAARRANFNGLLFAGS